MIDLDNILIGDDTALIRLNEILGRKRREYGTRIIYSTKRPPPLYHQLNQEKRLLSPDTLMISIGRAICFHPIKDNFSLTHFSSIQNL